MVIKRAIAIDICKEETAPIWPVVDGTETPSKRWWWKEQVEYFNTLSGCTFVDNSPGLVVPEVFICCVVEDFTNTLAIPALVVNWPECKSASFVEFLILPCDVAIGDEVITKVRVGDL